MARWTKDALEQLLHQTDAATLRSMFRAGELMDIAEEDRGAFPRMAARMGRADLLRTLSENSHAINWNTDELGRNVLHHAALSGDVDTIAYAVNMLGFDPLRGDSSGRTALDLAKEAAHADALAWLEEKVGFTLEEAYRNPVRRGFYPDPSVVRVGEEYYMVNSTFVQFPCLPISHSRDLVHWRTIGHAITNLAWSGLEGLPGGHGYWAPDISYHNGRFWVIATLRRNTKPFRLQMITSALHPEGPYDEPKFLDVDGIDPSLFTDDDGRRYMVVNPGAQIVEIGEDGSMLSEPEMIYYGSVRIKTEGPHLLKKDGWYYLFEAEGGTGAGHMETVARSRHLRGPYQPCPHNPILGKTQENAPIRRSGHGKPVMTQDGRWYMVYLCGRDVGGATMLGRETALDEMTWTADGWPMVNGLKGPSCLQRCPFDLPAEAEEGFRWVDFISPRGEIGVFAQAIDGGWKLHAGADAAGLAPASLLLRRQGERRFTQTVTVDAAGLGENSTAGLMGYYDENSFYLFGLAHTTEGWALTVEEQIGKERSRRALCPVSGTKTVLRIEADGSRRTLCHQTQDGWVTLCVIDAAYLSDEGLRMGKRFTGATLGMAAIGTGEAVFADYQEAYESLSS